MGVPASDTRLPTIHLNTYPIGASPGEQIREVRHTDGAGEVPPVRRNRDRFGQTSPTP